MLFTNLAILQIMKIDFSPLDYKFKTKPLLIGGKAKEYYGIRKSGKDTDLIVTEEDYLNLSQKYPDFKKDLWGDLGVKVKGFEIWKTIVLFYYDFYSKDSIEKEAYKIISLEKLLFMTALAMKEPKYREDLKLTVDKIIELQYKVFDASKYKK